MPCGFSATTSLNFPAKIYLWKLQNCHPGCEHHMGLGEVGSSALNALWLSPAEVTKWFGTCESSSWDRAPGNRLLCLILESFVYYFPQPLVVDGDQLFLTYLEKDWANSNGDIVLTNFLLAARGAWFLPLNHRITESLNGLFWKGP